MSRVDKIKEGDLLIRRADKKPCIVLEVARYNKRNYGPTAGARHRKKCLLLFPDGRQTWIVDTALKVGYYLPGDPWFDDIR